MHTVSGTRINELHRLSRAWPQGAGPPARRAPHVLACGRRRHLLGGCGSGAGRDCGACGCAGIFCAPAALEVLDGGRAVRVKLHEGFFHQVKRMVAAVGGPVEQLHRDAVGPLRVDGGGDGEALPPGSMRALTPAERRALGDLLPADRVARAVLPAEIEERRRPKKPRVA